MSIIVIFQTTSSKNDLLIVLFLVNIIVHTLSQSCHNSFHSSFLFFHKLYDCNDQEDFFDSQTLFHPTSHIQNCLINCRKFIFNALSSKKNFKMKIKKYENERSKSQKYLIYFFLSHCLKKPERSLLTLSHSSS